MSPRQDAYRGPGCPRCWTPLPESVLEHGRVYCGECTHEFTAAIFHPPAPRRPPGPAADPAGAACARHARNPAVAACERCGAFMCALCRVEVEGKMLCAACFDRGRSEGSLQAAQTTFRSWRTLGVHLALLGLFMYPLGILIGPASIFASLKGIGQSRKDGDEGGMGGVVTAVLLAALVTLFGGLFLLAIGGALASRQGR